MGSFDKSYYDILNRYQGIIKEGMVAKPIVYKKTGNTYVPANDLDLKVVPPQLLFTKSEDPAAPFVPYDPQAAGQTSTVANPPDTTKPSISVTGDGNTPLQGSGPQSSTNVAGMRIQYPSTQQTNVTPSTQTPVTNTPSTAPTQTGSTNTPASKGNVPAVTSTPPSRPGTTNTSTSLPTSQIGRKPTSATSRQQSAMRRA